ncbi:MAG: HD domain-containing phosphohydrolase [Synechococcus sp.]|nr:HD domain-containing phosphohydrolase [Synechococcus sp.]
MNSLELQLDIDLRQIIVAIETAVSLVGMDDTNHGKRVGYMASRLCQELGFSEADTQYAFELGLLHDCGVSTEQMHANLINYFDWDNAYLHCETAYALLKDFEPLAKFARPILYHHTPWEKLKTMDVSLFDKRMANIIFLVDRVDAIAASHYNNDILLFRTEALGIIEQFKGRYFDPALVNAFRELVRTEAFWISLKDRHITRYVWDMEQLGNNRPLTLGQLKHLSLILAYVVDQKSPFTAKHSVLVADLAKYLATVYGFSPEQCAKIEIAGLLHDLGKLHIADAILDKPGKLTEAERAIMNTHSYETYEILRHIKGLEEIAHWAAYHHEGLNGIGYPFHPLAQSLTTEARMIAVADVFQALVQDRPYRSGMSLEQALGILDEMVDSGKLDFLIVSLVHEHRDHCYQVAKGEGKYADGFYVTSTNHNGQPQGLSLKV